MPSTKHQDCGPLFMRAENCPIGLAGRREWTADDILFLSARVVWLWNRAAPLFKCRAQFRWEIREVARLKAINRLVGAPPIIARSLYTGTRPCCQAHGK